MNPEKALQELLQAERTRAEAIIRAERTYSDTLQQLLAKGIKAVQGDDEVANAA